MDAISKVAFYIAFQMLGILAGLKWGTFRDFIVACADILSDSKLTAIEKVNSLANLAIKILGKLGEAFDLLNIEQGTKPGNTIKPEPLI